MESPRERKIVTAQQCSERCSGYGRGMGGGLGTRKEVEVAIIAIQKSRLDLVLPLASSNAANVVLRHDCLPRT
jgi:hypothetical protein